MNSLSQSLTYLFCSKSPYNDISVDKTKAEQAKHILLVEELRAQRAKGEIDIIICGTEAIRASTTTKKAPRSMDFS